MIRLSGIGLANNNSHYMITETNYLYRDVDEKSFYFKFTCNNDDRVYYQGQFRKVTISYSNRDSNTVNGLDVSYNIDILDCAKLSRDFENITRDHIDSIIEQLLPKCMEVLKGGAINIKNQVFNVNVM